MKRVLFSFVAVSLFAVPALAGKSTADEKASPEPGKVLEFNTDYPGAVKQAKAQGKAMVVEFETAWCPFCRAMENVTFKDDDVIEAAKDLVLAKVDADTQKVLAKKFKTGDGFPLFVFLDRNQQELFRLDGYHPPDSFKLALKAAANENSPLTTAVRAAQSSPKDAGAQLALGDGLYQVGAIAAAAEAYGAAIKLGIKEGAAEERAVSRRAEHCRDMGEWSEAADLYKGLLKDHAVSERAPFYRLGLVKTYVGWGRDDLAASEVASLEKAHPDHPATRTARTLIE